MIPAMPNSGYTVGMKINGETQLLAVIGNPIAHSASPVMHNAVIADLGIKLLYRLKRQLVFLGIKRPHRFTELIIPDRNYRRNPKTPNL